MDIKINKDDWNRKQIFDFFSPISNPFYSITFRQDVTRLVEYTKTNNLSFYHSMVYLCTKAINEIEAFHYVIRGGDVYRIDDRDPSFTYLKKDSELFQIMTMPLEDSLQEFCRKAKENCDKQDIFIVSEDESDHLIYFSCLPWMDVTSVTNERDLQSPEAKDESIPHIIWGKYGKNGDKIDLGISVEVNHRLIDGLHIGKFAEKLSAMIESIGDLPD